VKFEDDIVVKHFSNVRYDKDKHLYVAGDLELGESVSKVVNRYIPYTDFDAIAESMDKKYDLPEGTTKKLWDLKAKASIAKGNLLHFFASIYPFRPNLRAKSDLEKHFKKFADSFYTMHVPIATELHVYHKDKLIHGKIDNLSKNIATGNYALFDLKTNEDLFKNFDGMRMKAPFDVFLNNNFGKYAIQLNLYKSMIEQAGVKVDELFILWITEEGYKIVDVPDIKELIDKI